MKIKVVISAVLVGPLAQESSLVELVVVGQVQALNSWLKQCIICVTSNNALRSLTGPYQSNYRCLKF